MKQGEIKSHYNVMTKVHSLLLEMIQTNSEGIDIDYIIFFFTQHYPVSESHLRKRIMLMDKLGIVIVSSENKVYSERLWKEVGQTKQRWNEKPFPVKEENEKQQ